jgi:type IV secretory pathway VirB4 component
MNGKRESVMKFLSATLLFLAGSFIVMQPDGHACIQPAAIMDSGGGATWLVAGIRKDARAERNRIKVEEEKPEAELGTCIHPEACQQ